MEDQYNTKRINNIQSISEWKNNVEESPENDPITPNNSEKWL